MSTGQTTLATITQLQPIDVAFTLPEDQVPQVAARMRGGVSLAVTVLDRARTRPLARGRLSTLDNQMDVTTGTLKAKGALRQCGRRADPQPVRQR